ncbi:hypothetical protein ACRZ5S_23135 (plasmid) [Vibrio scophthalmi]|uniref:hypothetical protein n=1 Tax=Vibrio scophthalmi TaxID=45658 RepID=UPI003EBF774E
MTLLTLAVVIMVNGALSTEIHHESIEVVGHSESIDLRDVNDVRFVRIDGEPLLTQRQTIVVGQQSAALLNQAQSTTSIELNSVTVPKGESRDLSVTIAEDGQLLEPLRITQSEEDQHIEYRLSIDTLRSDYEHPVQPQCNAPFSVIEGDDSWSVKDDVCRYDILANIHCTAESPTYNATTETCTGSYSHAANYSCPSGYSRSGTSCRRTARSCRYDDNNYVHELKWGPCYYDPEIYGFWNGRKVSIGGTYTATGEARAKGGKQCREDYSPTFSYAICGPVTQTISATPYCNAGYTLSGSTCRKTTTASPSYSCDDPQASLLSKVCRKEAVTQPVCVPSHPHFDPDNEVCRSYGG